MYSLQAKSGDFITIGDDVTIRIFQISDPDFGFRITIEAPEDVPITQEDVSERDWELSEAEKTRELAKELVSQMSLPDHNSGLLGPFLSELVLQVLSSTKEDRRERQMRGIAAAKKRGVRFGKPKRPLPEHFDEAHQAWRSGKLTLLEAAQLCGMPRSTFYTAVLRQEEEERQQNIEEETTKTCHSAYSENETTLSYSAAGRMI